MEIWKRKFNGEEVNILFTGKRYIFEGKYSGLLCVATRHSKENNTFSLMVTETNSNKVFKFVNKFIQVEDNRHRSNPVEIVYDLINHYNMKEFYINVEVGIY